MSNFISYKVYDCKIFFLQPWGANQKLYRNLHSLVRFRKSRLAWNDLAASWISWTKNTAKEGWLKTGQRRRCKKVYRMVLILLYPRGSTRSKDWTGHMWVRSVVTVYICREQEYPHSCYIRTRCPFNPSIVRWRKDSWGATRTETVFLLRCSQPIPTHSRPRVIWLTNLLRKLLLYSPYW